MRYEITIKIPWAKIGCNPGDLFIEIDPESKSGIRKLGKYLQEKFGKDNVAVWEVTPTEPEYKKVKL